MTDATERAPRLAAVSLAGSQLPFLGFATIFFVILLLGAAMVRIFRSIRARRGR